MSNDHPEFAGTNGQTEEVHLSDYLAVLYRRRKTLLLIFVVVVTAVVLYTFLAPPVYEATATLHVRDDKVQGGANFLADLGLSRDAPIETEIEILKSRTNIEEVVRRLHLDWIVDDKPEGVAFQVRDFASDAEEPLYTIRLLEKGRFEVLDADKKVVGQGAGGELVRSGGFSLLLDGLSGPAGDAFTLRLDSFQRAVKNLREQIRASEIGKGTSIIKVSFQDTDPERAREVVNTLSQVYLERSIVLKTMEASRSVEFIGEQLETIRTGLNQAEEELQEYKRASGVVKLDSEAESFIEHLAEGEKNVTAILLRLRQAEFARDALTRAIGRQESYAPAILLDEPVVAVLAQNLAALEVEKHGMLVELSPAHPAVKSVQDRITETQRKLLSTYETLIEGLNRSAQGLREDMARYEDELKKLPQAELELARLTRRATVNADIYTFLLQKHEEARIAKAATISNINVIDPAIAPEDPVKPQKKKNLLLGLIVGGMMGVGFAFFREYLDDSIKDAESAKRLLGLPVLTVIPFIGRREDIGKKISGVPPKRTLISWLQPKSPAAEAFRALRTSLHFAASGKPSQVLLVTSTFPGEGKTTVSGNLACTMAQTGQKVVILGCDLRKPTLHELFERSKIPGLTEILVGDAELETSIQPTDMENLHFIPAGTVPPNPAELIGSERMRDLVAELRRRYDIILLDAPPVLAVTDAALLTGLADHSLVVVFAGGVGAKAAQRMIEILRSTQTSLVGLVINDKAGKAAEYYGGRYYGRTYAYGYGETGTHTGKDRRKKRRMKD